MGLKSVEKLKSAMYGVKHAETVPTGWRPRQVVSRTAVPPSYILLYAIRILYEGKIWKGVEKSAWEIVLRYENEVWLVSDWKNYAWSVSSDCQSEDVLNSFIKKINSAAAIVDSMLKAEAKAALSREQFSLRNDFTESKNIYLTYRKLYRKSLVAADPALITGPVGELRSSLVNVHFEKTRESEHHLIAMAVFFFAHTEVILASCYSLLESKNLSYNDYQKMDWNEKFKAVVGAEFMREHAELYSELVKIRRNYRNIPVHSSPMFLFPTENIGLIPASFHQHNDPVLSGRYDPDQIPGKKISALFKKTLRHFEKHHSTRRGYYYAKSGLPIHIDKEARDELRCLLGSRKAFIEEVQGRVDLEHALINGEI